MSTKSKVLQEVVNTAQSTSTQDVLQTPVTICRRRHANVFLMGELKHDKSPTSLGKEKHDKPPVPLDKLQCDCEPPATPGLLLYGDKFTLLLISIGPFSDAMLDCIRMQDNTLLQLHILLGTVCTS